MSEKKATREMVGKLFGPTFANNFDYANVSNLRAVKTWYVAEETGHNTARYDLGDKGRGVSIAEALETSLSEPEWWCPLLCNGRWWEPTYLRASWMPDDFELHDPHKYGYLIGSNTKEDEHLPSDHPRRRMRAILYQLDRDIDGRPRDEKRILRQMIQSIFDGLDGLEDQRVWKAVDESFTAGMTYPMAYAGFWDAQKIVDAGVSMVAQNSGRSEGSKNKISRAKRRLIERWRSNEGGTCVERLDRIAYSGEHVDGVLLVELGSGENAGYYKLAGKGKFIPSASALSNLRRWT